MLFGADKKPDHGGTEGIANDEFAYKREQVELLYHQMPFILLADVLAGTFLFLILLTFSSSLWSFLWIFLLVSSTALRALIVSRQRQIELNESNISQYWRFLIGGSFTAGIIWGNAWVMLPGEPEFLQLAIVGLWLGGMQAGAATTMVMIKEVFIAYSLPAATFFIAYILTGVDENKFIMAGAYVMYLGFILPIAFRINSDFNRTIRLQITNSSLQKILNREAQRLIEKEIEVDEQRKRGNLLQTEKEFADEKLQAAAEDRLLLLDAVGEGIFGLNNRGDITFINSTALRMLQLREVDLLGHAALKLISSSGAESATNVEAYVAIAKCFQEGRPVLNMESVLEGKNGLKLPVRFSCTPIRKDNVVIGAVVSFTDVSKQKEMEAMLLQSQKMEAIGRLTGGVSHDFNNLLTVILGNLKFLRRRIEEDAGATELLDKVMNAASSGADLNNRLLSFSREQNLETDLVIVEDMLGEMTEFLDRLLGEEIHLEINTNEGESAILIDHTQLENAILNLSINAKDAMPEGGTLTIATKSTELSKSYVQGDDSFGEANYVEISITDTGVGIPEDTQRQIFEPFFTTKEKGRGTGLGLSTVYGFVRQSGGNITVDSREGEWTNFKIYLPISDTVAIPKKVADKIVQLPEKFEGTVLVVEDDPNVREVATKTLTDAGYSVISAHDGRAGLKQFDDHPEIELVFSDVIMPGGMSGISMAEKILEKRPGIPILLATGYTEKSRKDRISNYSNVVFVSKPYDTDELPGVVHSLMMQEVS